MELFWVAPLRLCVVALKGFCLVARLQRLAGRKDRGKRPTATARPAGAGLASPAGKWGGLWRNNPIKLTRSICWRLVGVMEYRRSSSRKIGQCGPVGRGEVGVGLDVVTLAAAQAGI